MKSDLLGAAVIRRCIRAREGYSILSADYDQIEMRIIGAIAGEEAMIQAAHEGRSMHELTCELMYGELPYGVDSWKAQDPYRYKLAKVAGFCAVYGGGAQAISDQADVPLSEARKVATQYKEAFAALAEYKQEATSRILNQALSRSQQVQYRELRKLLWAAESDEDRDEVEKQIKKLCWGKVGWIITSSGRKLYVDAIRAYSVVNYEVQSEARDVLARGALRLHKSPYRETVLMLVHDETIGEARNEEAEFIASEYSRILTTEFRGVPLTAKGEVLGQSWGDGYQ